MRRTSMRTCARRIGQVAVGLGASALCAPALHAYTITISSGSRAIYLQVGEGGYSGTHLNGGTPGNNGTINTVSVTVPAAVVASGTVQQMTSNSTVALSPIDGFAFCSPPSQVYIGAWSRPGFLSTGVATLTVTTPANLTSGSDTIPFSQISWVMSGNGDTVFQFPDGSFTGGTQTLGTLPANTWKEQCMTFRYANSVLPAAGAYSGRAVYTLSLP
ncbi:MAG: hypothetical protein ACK4ZW_06180 [Blastomonas sp.]